ncbi:ISAs1 family transposase [Streptomyces griseofuscus]|uniref:ISAs1 family transposase n=1 Tax=Streptomyces TaxID=1883 RepID=UPI00081D9C68|nr:MULTISPECIES: ISAs1 family transposase [unclassified Streptomyces]SCF57894.1 Transposase DDE domain-containing protein [Streptomyces sp. DconLS]SCF75393.1 Transposase DDE domain-containing protein [Streptomyces sp. LamerLS-31b]
MIGQGRRLNRPVPAPAGWSGPASCRRPRSPGPPRTAGDRCRRQSPARLAHPRHRGDHPARRDGPHRSCPGPAPGRRQSNEFPAFRPPLDSVDLTSTVITTDALHTQHAHGTYLRERGAHYIAQVDANHPGPFDLVRRLPWREITLDHRDRTRSHHRLEIRRLKTTAFAHLHYPDARQALQVVRWGKDFTSGKLTIERVYLITSLPPGAVTGAQLADWIRGHWKIGNLPHHVRDRTFREDDSKIQADHLPRIMAGLRNLAIGVHRQDGHTNIAAALRHTAHD